MKIVPTFGLGLVFLTLLGMAETPKVQPEIATTDLEVFVREGCPHCEAAKIFLEQLKKDKPKLQILFHDVEKDSQALARLKGLAEKYEVQQLGVPVFHLQGELIVGFDSDETTGQQLKELLGRPPPQTNRGDSDGTCSLHSTTPCDSPKVSISSESHTVDVPWFGSFSLQTIGLPTFTILLGLLDGFNPCAMWVLLFLLSLLATLRNRRKMFLLAGTFVLISGLVYFAFMAAWLNAFLIIGYSRAIQIIIGSIAIIAGAIHMKDFVFFQRGISLSIPDVAKPELYRRARQIVQSQQIEVGLVGIVILAVLVNLIEFICTAGLPALYTEILSRQNLLGWEFYTYLALYNIAYITDDVIMVFIGVITLSHRKLQEQEGKWLKLLSGGIMLVLGVTLLATPEWLM